MLHRHTHPCPPPTSLSQRHPSPRRPPPLATNRAQVRTNMDNTVTQIKRLLGRKFSEPGVQQEMKEHLNFTIVPTANDEIGIEVRVQWRWGGVGRGGVGRGAARRVVSCAQSAARGVVC